MSHYTSNLDYFWGVVVCAMLWTDVQREAKKPPRRFELRTYALRTKRHNDACGSNDNDLRSDGEVSATDFDHISALLAALAKADLSPTAKAGIKAIIEIDRGTDCEA
jgi:hypothetical protein